MKNLKLVFQICVIFEIKYIQIIIIMNSHGIRFSVSTNDLEVIESGVVHMTTPEIEFKIDNLTILCIFEEDTSTSDTRYDGKVVDNTLTFKLTNFNNPMGEGVDTPLNIATIQNRNLYFYFYVNSNLNGSVNSSTKFREFKYTFLLGKESDVEGK